VLHSGKPSPSVLGSSPSAFDTQGRGGSSSAPSPLSAPPPPSLLGGRPLQETQALPRVSGRVSGFAEGFLSGPRQRNSLPSAALGTEVLTALNPLLTVGPSAGWGARRNHLFAESQHSARSAPSEKERAPSHLGCHPLCRRPRREAVGTDATCAERPLLSSRQRH
jgi:hypothetical protein